MFLMIVTALITFFGLHITYKNSLNNSKKVTTLIR